MIYIKKLLDILLPRINIISEDDKLKIINDLHKIEKQKLEYINNYCKKLIFYDIYFNTNIKSLKNNLFLLQLNILKSYIKNNIDNNNFLLLIIKIFNKKIKNIISLTLDDINDQNDASDEEEDIKIIEKNGDDINVKNYNYTKPIIFSSNTIKNVNNSKKNLYISIYK